MTRRSRWRAEFRSGPTPWSKGVQARCRCRCRASTGRLGSLSSAGWVPSAGSSGSVSPKKMLFAWLSGWVRGRRARGGAVGSARCPWGPACACDGGPAFQRLFLGSPRSVRSAERPLDKNAVRPSLSSPLPSCQLREVRHPSIPFLPSFGLVPATDGAVLNPASRRRLATHAL